MNNSQSFHYFLGEASARREMTRRANFCRFPKSNKRGGWQVQTFRFHANFLDAEHASVQGAEDARDLGADDALQDAAHMDAMRSKILYAPTLDGNSVSRWAQLATMFAEFGKMPAVFCAAMILSRMQVTMVPGSLRF